MLSGEIEGSVRMEYVKIVGAALIILAGAGFGACPVHKMKERTKEFETLYFCLLRLKSEISHGGKPLPEAITTVQLVSLCCKSTQKTAPCLARSFPGIRQVF